MSDPRIEAVARALAMMEPGEEWVTATTGDDEYRNGMREEAESALRAADEADERAGIQRVRLAVLAERLVNVIRDGAAKP